MSYDFPYTAMILDLDGVITDTRPLHLAAWKETMNEFLSIQGRRDLFHDEDYNRYVDGKPREEGILSFLNSRNIKIPDASLKYIARKKDNLYLKQLRQDGPRVFEDSVNAIKSWKEAGIPVAVVSSSRNCSEVLDQAGIKDLFDVQVDGLTAEKSHLRGKPEADYFLEAANLLHKRPEECAIVEDSIAGIQAGVIGNFKGVIGMSRNGQTPAGKLYAVGAQMVIDSLEKIGKKENALIAWDNIKQKIGDREVALFIDFDGTLAEIVPHPADAAIRPGIVPVLNKCSRSLKSSIISGRDRQDVKGRVQSENLFYAGCHGFDISGPGGFHFSIEEVTPLLPDLEIAKEQIIKELKSVKGIELEKKKFFIAIHFRNVPTQVQDSVKQIVNSVIKKYKNLSIREGKKVIEVGPRFEWGKGHAIKKLCEILQINKETTVPIFLGDDITDEDGFKEINGWGIGIKVSEFGDQNSAAQFWLKNPSEVESFLIKICHEYAGRKKVWRLGT